MKKEPKKLRFHTKAIMHWNTYDKQKTHIYDYIVLADDRGDVLKWAWEEIGRRTKKWNYAQSDHFQVTIEEYTGSIRGKLTVTL